MPDEVSVSKIDLFQKRTVAVDDERSNLVVVPVGLTRFVKGWCECLCVFECAAVVMEIDYKGMFVI